MSVTTTLFDDEHPLRPGFLVGPLGWLNERLTKTLASDRELFVSLFELLSVSHARPWPGARSP